MSRVHLISPIATFEDVTDTLDTIYDTFHTVPNMFLAVANSPAALEFMWGGFEAMREGVLDRQLVEKIAVAVAKRNKCDYCLETHMARGMEAGAKPEEMNEAQFGRSKDPQTQAALVFVLKIIDNRAQVSGFDVQELKYAGFDDEEVVEIVAHLSLNMFTNYINVALMVPQDSPRTRLKVVE